MTILSRATAIAFASVLLMGTAYAQTNPPAAAPAAPAPAAAAPKMQKPMTPESAACYKQADEKNLHGKERKKFHRQCMKETKAGGAPAAAPKQ